MSDILTLVPHSSHAVQVDIRPPRYGLSALGSLISTWHQRKLFRQDLARLARDNPELIDDIGLTPQWVKAEIEKPFWWP